MSAARYTQIHPEMRQRATVIAAIVIGAVVLLLLSACVNAGALLLARGAARQREFAVKMALGASRRQLMGQLLAETILVCSAGGLLGLVFARWTAVSEAPGRRRAISDNRRLPRVSSGGRRRGIHTSEVRARSIPRKRGGVTPETR